MTDVDVISLSSDSSRPSSPFINISEVLNDSEKRTSSVHDICSDLNSDDTVNGKYGFRILPTTKISPIKDRILHSLSDSDNSEIDICGEYEKPNNLGNKHNAEKERFMLEYQPLQVSTDQVDPKPSTSRKYDVTSRKNPKQNIKMTKEQRLEEKLRKQSEKEKKKAEKLAAQELKKQMKPGNCIKYMTVMLDSSLLTCSFSGTLIAAVQNSEAKYQILTQSVPLMISWTREIPGSIATEEEDLVVIWQWQFVIPAVKNHTLCSQIQEIKAQYPSKSISLVVYGLNGYFSYLKSKRKRSAEPSKASKRRSSPENEEFPYVTRRDIEEELIELQIMANCNHRLIECPEDLGQLIVQITKAIAERPFKLEKQKRELESLEWFATGDSRDCVTVDKAGNGLLRLWQQQLCQFNLSGHDIAQAIAAAYPSPLSLVKAYNKCCTQKEAECLLKDIQVRRCQGPLSSSRRIGPELSKKIYTFFCSTEGDKPLSQEQ